MSSTSVDYEQIAEDNQQECHTGSQTTGTASSPLLTKRNSAPTPIPWRPVIALLMLNAIHPLAFDIIFPFINQMILELGIVDDPEKVGYYSGFIESIFSTMSLFAIIPCAHISDSYGRKPVILLGMGGLALSTALFGVSTSFAMMVVTRCVAGATGAAWLTTKVMIAEITDRTNQASVFSWCSISYRVGQTIGLPIGGLLSHPERNFYPWFQARFWYDHPFSLPCFVAAALAAVFVAIGYFNMKETLPSHKDRQSSHSDEECDTRTPANIADALVETASIASATYGTFPQPSHKHKHKQPAHVSRKPKAGSKYLAILTPQVIRLLTSTFCLVLTAQILFALYPLFAFTPIESGGLGLSEAEIGIQMAVGSINNMIVMFCYPLVERRFGTLRLYQTSMWFWSPCYLCMPLLNMLARRIQAHGETTVGSSWLLWSALWMYFTLWSIANCSWSGSGIMINDAAPSQDSLSAINGMNQMAISLPQALAPAFSTSVFALSLKSGIAGGHIAPITIGVFATAVAMHALTLKPSTHDWREDIKKRFAET